MFRSAFSKALALQLSRSAAHASKKRAFNTCAVTARPLKVAPFPRYHTSFKRTFASVPESVTVKPASTENGIDITEKAVKVDMLIYMFYG
jgi:hypothetical protein